MSPLCEYELRHTLKLKKRRPRTTFHSDPAARTAEQLADSQRPTFLFPRLLTNSMREDHLRATILSTLEPEEEPDDRIDQAVVATLKSLKWPRSVRLTGPNVAGKALLAEELLRQHGVCVSEVDATEDTKLHSEALALLGYKRCRAPAALLGFAPHGSCGGEDMAIAQLLEKRGVLVGGVYVDVGCGAGRFSNTHNLATRAGWHGICIDALSDAVAEMVASRPRAIGIHAFVSARDGDHRTLCVPRQADLRRFAATDKHEWKCKCGCDRLDVQTRSLWTLIRGHLAPTNTPTLLSITCEGEDSAVLEGARIQDWKPLVISIQFKSTDEFERQKSILEPIGYTLWRRMDWISIFELRDPTTLK